MKKQASNSRIKLFLSSFIAAGLLSAVVADSAHAFRFGRKGFSTNDGAFDVDYVVDASTVSAKGVPNSGSVIDFGVTVNDESSGQPLYPLLSSISPVSVSFSKNTLKFENGCTEDLCDSSDALKINLRLISDSLAPSAPELADGLLDIKYVFDLTGSKFSDKVPIDSDPKKGITIAERDAGIDGRFELFFSQPAGSDSIFSFGKFQYDTALPTYIPRSIGGIGSIDGLGGEVAFLNPFQPVTAPVSPKDVPEPSAIAGLFILGAAYSTKRALKKSQ